VATIVGLETTLGVIAELDEPVATRPGCANGCGAIAAEEEEVALSPGNTVPEEARCGALTLEDKLDAIRLGRTTVLGVCTVALELEAARKGRMITGLAVMVAAELLEATRPGRTTARGVWTARLELVATNVDIRATDLVVTSALEAPLAGGNVVLVTVLGVRAEDDPDTDISPGASLGEWVTMTALDALDAVSCGLTTSLTVAAALEFDIIGVVCSDRLLTVKAAMELLFAVSPG
jgi:hypothetical protein